MSGQITYDYVDINGKLTFQVVRTLPKKFFQRRLVDGKWINNLDGVDKVLYNLPQLKDASSIIIVEGEKDADRLSSALKGHIPCLDSVVVTTCCGGSSAWRKEYNTHLAGKYVYIVPDNDAPGFKLAITIANGIYGSARTVRIVSLPGLKEREDVSDFFDKGFSLLEFIAACNQTKAIDRSFLDKHLPKKKERIGDWPLIIDSDITPDKIFIARNYPISKLIDVDRGGKAYCINPDHEDVHRSMDTRKNFLYCYGCGFHCEVIELAMRIFRCPFEVAVKKLYELYCDEMKCCTGRV